jgi:hypothetical protein
MLSTASNSPNDAANVKAAEPFDLSASVGATKEALISLIAQEMANSLLKKGADIDDDDDDGILMKALHAKLAEAGKKRTPSTKTQRRISDGSKTRRRSSGGTGSRRSSKTSPSPSKKYVDPAVMDHEYLAEMYYAQMNGTGGESRRSSIGASSIPEDLEIDVSGVADDDSFAGGDLDELLSPPTTPSAPKKRLSNGTESTCSVSSASVSVTSGNSLEEMNVDEIREYVLQSIPQAVRDQIPESAWGEIFSPSGRSKSSKTSQARSISMSGDIVKNVNDLNDDESQISEISGFTNVFPDGRRVEKKQSESTDDVEFDSTDFSTTGENSVRTGFHSFEETERNSLADGSSVQRSSVQKMASSAVKTTSPSGRITKKVAFSEISMRYYERILTDNPSVQSGPAIGIGWRYKRAGTFEVDWYEQSKGTPRSSDELVMNRRTREKILRDAGYSSKEIADMVRVILKVKNQRKTTVNNLSTQDMEEAVESAKKRVGRLLSFGKSKGML